MGKKISKYTKTVLMRLSPKTMLELASKSLALEINEAVYCRKAVELCLRKNLINGHKE